MLQTPRQTIKGRTLKTAREDTTLTITDITQKASQLPAFDDHERIWHGHDPERGLDALVAIHNTALGPGLGGTRVWPHATFEDALTDVLRLSRGMTFKSAIAGMDFGGGKALIIADSKTGKTPALLEAYAEMLAALEGQFFTGEDVGFTVADADFLRERTPNVTGTTIGGSGNPSPVTAHGVFLGLKSALRHRGVERLNGVRVAVQGLGSVGWTLCEKLHDEGAQLTVADLDASRVVKAQEQFRAEVVGTDQVVQVPAQVFAPCALGGVLSQETIPQLGSKIVAGAANNQLARHEDAALLLKQGVLYAPDYVINAGGLLNVAAELAPGGYDREATMARVETIPATLATIFQRAEQEGRPTNDVASDIAFERIDKARAG